MKRGGMGSAWMADSDLSALDDLTSTDEGVAVLRNSSTRLPTIDARWETGACIDTLPKDSIDEEKDTAHYGLVEKKYTPHKVKKLN